MSADHRLKSNILFSFFEKGGIVISQFISSLLLSKYLPREQFGTMAVIGGAFAFLQLGNISLENILMRDFQTHKEDIDNSMSRFFSFNVIKSLILGILAVAIGFFYSKINHNNIFLLAACSLAITFIMDIWVSPLILYSSFVFQQKLVTQVSFLRWGLNVIGLLFLIKYPRMEVIVIKDIAVVIVTLLAWRYLAKYQLGIQIRWKKIDWLFIKSNLVGFSIYVHIIGVISLIVYKADAFILYYFSDLTSIGNYNIALSLANVASVIPSVLIFQNNVALSHCQTLEEARKVTIKFLRFSLVLGIGSFLGFVLLGKAYLNIVSRPDKNEIYAYLLYIVSGVLIVKMIISPFVAYINMKGDVKKLLYRVQVPLLVIVLLNYSIFSYLWGTSGAAISNLINGIIWLILIVFEIKSYGFSFADRGSFRDDFNQVIDYVKKIGA